MSKFALALAALAALALTLTGCQKAPNDGAVEELKKSVPNVDVNLGITVE